MKYERPAYLQSGVELIKGKKMFAVNEYVDAPKIDYPITPIENYKRVVAHDKPMWVPNFLTEFDSFMLSIPGSESTRPAINRSERSEFVDAFGVTWVWVPEAGGPMLKPGTKFMESILDWEKMVKFPDISKVDWPSIDGDFMKTRYNPDKILHYNLGQSMTERLVAILGGYEEMLVSLLEEPEAVRAFFDRFADYMIEVYDILKKHYPLNVITIHDDWGTERDTFFSEKVMETLVFEPTKRIMDHIHAQGVAIELHSCGKIERFMPYILDMGVDFLQIQTRANNVPMLKEKYGDKIGFCSMIEGIDSTAPIKDEQKYLEAIRKTVDLYAKGGGMYSSISVKEPEYIWSGTYELFCYSREFYEKENG